MSENRVPYTENRGADAEFVSAPMQAALDGQAVTFPMPQDEQLVPVEQPAPTQAPEPPQYPTEEQIAAQQAEQADTEED